MFTLSLIVIIHEKVYKKCNGFNELLIKTSINEPSR